MSTYDLRAYMDRQRRVMLRWSRITGKALTPEVVAVWAARYHEKHANQRGVPRAA